MSIDPISPGSTGDEVPAGMIRVMQIIHLALLAGVSAFLVFVLFQRLTAPAAAENPAGGAEPNQMLCYMAAGVFAVASVLSFVMPTIITKGQIAGASRPDFQLPIPDQANSLVPATLSGYLASVYQVSLIIGLALLEGPAFFGTYVLMATGQWWTIAIPLIAIALMAVRFPSAMRVRTWVDERREEIERMRSFS